ncbi:MAG: hypothetical protein JWS10_4165 [Cypionkella sp.]|uniref:hypothetical protein n=1 Tax=Cypionkella sp. TaxID=2811411 RepID=UPI0026089244|nr:hypothetical protein [Cypionkella sp.]MDB5661550.1 hypothetical protein [Cypionkella sp.]
MIEILRLSLPITVWLTGFSGVYALQGLACSQHWPTHLDARPVLLSAAAVTIALQILLLIAVRYAPSQSRFVQITATTLAYAALVAAVWTVMPVLALSVCN